MRGVSRACMSNQSNNEENTKGENSNRRMNGNDRAKRVDSRTDRIVELSDAKFAVKTNLSSASCFDRNSM